MKVRQSVFVRKWIIILAKLAEFRIIVVAANIGRFQHKQTKAISRIHNLFKKDAVNEIPYGI